MLEEALVCLALNVYFEARSEPVEGQRAVAEVTLKRASRRGESVCATVYAPGQFSWTRLPAGQRGVDDARAWLAAVRVAEQALRAATDHARGATHFHADYVEPFWAGSLCRTTRIGRHIFYADCPAEPAATAP